MTIAMALLLVAGAPSPEAEALGRRLAETGTLATLLPMMVAKETEDLVAAQGGLSAADQAVLRAVAAETAKSGADRVMKAEGDAFAAALSVEDLKALVAFNQSETARRYRAAQPTVIAATMKSMEGMDFKKDVMAAFCRKTGKGCDAE